MSQQLWAILGFIVLGTIVRATGTCQILIQGNDNRPTVMRKIGNRVIYLPNFVSSLNLYHGEIITLQCETSFKSPSGYSGQSKIGFTCGNNYYNNEIKLFECNNLKWNLYETSNPFWWCPPPLQSYVVGHSNGRGNYTSLAGICYNYIDMSVQSMQYVASKESIKNLPQFSFREYTPNLEIRNVAENFVRRHIDRSNYDDAQMRRWINFAKFDSESLIQNSKLQTHFKELGGLIDITWWSGLRLGNWQLYEEALNKHIETEGYDYEILAGISGSVFFPIYKESCHKSRTLVEVHDNMNQKIPFYVWHLLKPSRPDSENLVVIGINSPFYEFHNVTDIVFCNNICPQIDWLQETHSTFNYASMGVIFCCSMDDVIESNRLDYFPPAATPTMENVYDDILNSDEEA